MTDYLARNKEYAEELSHLIGDVPGLARLKGALNGKVITYAETQMYVGLSREDRAKAFNNLAFLLRRLGYGRESSMCAQRSIMLDPDNINQVIANKGFIAYNLGLIEGRYEEGIEAYKELDKYMKERGLFDATAQIKSAQNRAQILHRMGMNYVVDYGRASATFEEALAVYDTVKNKLSPEEKLQYLGQIGYGYAKTLVHMGRAFPDAAATCLPRALEQIEKGLEFINSINNFGFERACFVAVKAEVLAEMGQKDEALVLFREALEGQRKFGPTVGSRIASTMHKILQLDPNATFENETRTPFKIAVEFHGSNDHPDIQALFGPRIPSLPPRPAPSLKP